jgi:6-phosphogluconolactonase
VDADTGQLTRRGEIPAAGGPSVLAISPDHRVLYVGHRNVPSISSFRIDQSGGGLAPVRVITPAHAPTFLALDRTGAWMLSAYYQGGFAAVHRIAADGSVTGEPTEWLATAVGAHAIQTDPTNSFAFVPHIARLNDNVLEPPRDNPGSNMIAQFRFDAGTGRLRANSPARVEPAERLGPRHLCFHPTQNLVFFANEQGCGVTSYRLDPARGTLTAEQTVSSLPEGFSARNTCSQIHLTPSGRFLYVANRGHNSIAGFSVDAPHARLAPLGRVPTEAVPGAFALDPSGNFLFAAGTVSGRLAAYRINQETGALTPLATYEAGQRPAALLVTDHGA